MLKGSRGLKRSRGLKVGEVSRFYRELYSPYVRELKELGGDGGMSRRQLEEYLERGIVDCRVMMRSGKDVGFAMTGRVSKDLSRPMLLISDFYVKPGCRRCGVGTNAFAEILAESDMPIFFTVHSGNSAALAFWTSVIERNGLVSITPELPMIVHAGRSNLFCVDKPSNKNGDLLMKSIDCLRLKPRTANCLKRKGLRTLGDVLGLTEDEADTIRNFGIQSRAEVRKAMKKEGLAVKW